MSVSIWEGSRAERVAAALEEIAGNTHILDDTAGAGEIHKTWSASKLTGMIGNLDNDLAARVNKPLTSPDGTSGQLLRTNGDGTTTWVDEGTPTDAQVDSAVSDWLDEHPEATTTVEDGAITYAKLNSGLVATVAEIQSYLGLT